MHLVIGRLLLIHGLIRPAEDVLILRILTRMKRSRPFGDGKGIFVRSLRLVFRRHRRVHLPETPLRLVLLRPIQDGDKLIPADPVQVFPSEHGLQYLRRIDDHHIPALVAVFVVGLLQPVQVEHEPSG